jgi:hypothetical protein
MALREKERAAKGIVWTREQHSRDDWPRAWKWIGPAFGDCDPKSVTPEQLIDPDLPGLRPLVARKVSEREANRIIKVWRALWARMGALRCEGNGLMYCEPACDPSFQFTNPAAPPRQAVWTEGEAVRLVKQAWRSGYHGLAALLATAWDSQLSPVDVRKLGAAQRRRDATGTWFSTGRTKTGKAAIATLSKRAEFVLDAYLAKFGAEMVGPIFRNRSGATYSKDTLGDDFRDVRMLVFGPAEKRTLADFRRSGSVEALAGKVDPGTLSAKMANTLSQSNFLHATYQPTQLAVVREADTARKIGRRRLREQKPDESCPPPVQKLPAGGGDAS